jgi:cytochrome c oxidase subunit 3
MGTSRKTQYRVSGDRGTHPAEQFYPAKARLFFALTGSTVLFLALAFIYLVSASRTNFTDGFQLPKAFTLGTLFLLSSSFCIGDLANAFRRDDADRLKASLLVALIAAAAFLVSQTWGFMQLYRTGIQDASLFLMIGIMVHGIHMAGGFIHLGILGYQSLRESSDPVKKLLYFSNDMHLVRIQMASVYWHFNVGAWVMLFLVYFLA